MTIPGDPRLVRYRYGIFAGGKLKRWENAEWRKLDYCKFVNGLCTAEDKLDVSQRLYNELTHNPIALKYEEYEQKFAASNSILNQSCNVIMVSYFLPVVLSKSAKTGEWTAEWDSDHFAAFEMTEVSTIYVGTVRYKEGVLSEQDQRGVTLALKPFRCHPVFPENADQDVHFRVFCQYYLWQRLHDKVNVCGPLNEIVEDVKASGDLWAVFRSMHLLFRKKVIQLYHAGNLVWIHGYELMLLPDLLRRKLPGARIGFFFHAPFPTSDTWLTMFNREKLLNGMLAADQIGFHLNVYSRQFVATCCSLLGHNYYRNEFGQSVLDVAGREVLISSMHMGVDLPRLQQLCAAEGFVSRVGQWRDRFRGKTIVAGEHLCSD